MNGYRVSKEKKKKKKDKNYQELVHSSLQFIYL